MMLIDYLAFAQELEKIATIRPRKRAIPIKPENLAKKQHFDKRKTKTAGKKAKGVLDAVTSAKGKKIGKKALAVGSIIAGWETGKQGLKDYQMGRAYRKQMEGRRG
jgi:uncharacterized membrane protein YebE (DUF533 family)